MDPRNLKKSKWFIDEDTDFHTYFWGSVDKSLGFVSDDLIGIYSFNKFNGRRSYDALYNVLHAVDDGADVAEEYVENLRSSLSEKFIPEGNPPNDGELESFKEQVKLMVDLWLSLYKSKTSRYVGIATRVLCESSDILHRINAKSVPSTDEESSAADALTRVETQ